MQYIQKMQAKYFQASPLTIHTIQSEPVAKSTNFIYKHLLKFRFS